MPTSIVLVDGISIMYIIKPLCYSKCNIPSNMGNAYVFGLVTCKLILC